MVNSDIKQKLQHPRRSLGNRHRSQAEKFLKISNDESTYKLKGSLFFGSINKFKSFMHPSNFDQKIINLDCSESWIWDQSSIEILDNLTNKFKKQGISNKVFRIFSY